MYGGVSSRLVLQAGMIGTVTGMKTLQNGDSRQEWEGWSPGNWEGSPGVIVARDVRVGDSRQGCEGW